MREIKFRVWNKIEKKYEKQYSLTLDGKLIFHDGVAVFREMDWEMDKKHFDIQQYTGLKDKNGVEIYEGDICKAEYADDGMPFIYEVKIPDVYVDINNNDSYLRVKKDSLEVIGNVHENPELLEAKK